MFFPLARKAGFVSLLARVTSFTKTCLIFPKWELYTHRHGRFRERSESHFGMLIDAPEKSTCCVLARRGGSGVGARYPARKVEVTPHWRRMCPGATGRSQQNAGLHPCSEVEQRI